MQPALVRALTGAVAAITLVACSETTGTAGDRLTAGEATFLANALGAQSSAAAGSRASSIAAGEGAAARASIAAPFEFSLDATVPCPLGGVSRVRASMNGVVDAATQTLTADLAGSLEPASCVLRNQEGVVFTITGTPGLASEAQVSFQQGQPTGEHSALLEGSFSWSASDGRSGDCEVDYRATTDYATNRTSMTGDFCGSRVTYVGPVP